MRLLYQSQIPISKHSFSILIVVMVSQKREEESAIMKMEKDLMEF
jgi:hypothetical protein